MAKVSGSYDSVIRGVSQQVPQDRRSGQHWEQVNRISDPIRGNARRHGSVTQAVAVAGPRSQFSRMEAETASSTTITFFCLGEEYDLTFRRGAGSNDTFAWCYRRSTKTFLPLRRPDTDPVLELLSAGGVSAWTSLGQYLVLAGNSIVPGFTTQARWDIMDNRRFAVAWVRGGAYSRTFKVTITLASGAKFEAAYKTKAASYPEILDTSDLDVSDPEYQKKVNDRTNAWNSAATAWIGQAAEDITPENIADKLSGILTAAGLTGVSAEGGTIRIDHADLSEILADDGGDGSLINAVGSEVSAPELVSTHHWAGKVVRVRPKRSNAEDAFYLEAVPNEANATGWSEVYWRECAGSVTTPTSGLVLATVRDTEFCIASTAEGLAAITGIPDVPRFKPSEAGDEATSPIPHFLGRKIDYLGKFQDRLVIGCDAVLMFSRPGDYFNWFRQSILTVLDTDPVEQFALGSEDDVITSSAYYDRNMIFFGKRYWYSVSGSTPLNPSNNSVVIMREEQDANRAVPKASENLVFYCKFADGCTKPFQIQAGLLAESPDGTDIATQLDDYLQGEPLDILPIAAPSTVLLRTTGDRHRLYTYAYLDAGQGERMFDSWSSWTWDRRVGSLMGMSRDGADILAFVMREAGDLCWVACERFSLSALLSERPYMDALRQDLGWADLDTSNPEGFSLAYGRRAERPFTGAKLALAGNMPGAWLGCAYPSFFTPTNPFKLDRDGKAILSGRLTFSRVQVAVTDTGAMRAEVRSHGRKTYKDFAGRTLGSLENRVGYQPIVSGLVSVLIGKETRECEYTLSSVGWLPLTVTGLEWSGQFFNQRRG